MNRFRILEKDIPKVKSFLKNGKTDGVPKWAIRFKNKLSQKNGKIFFEETKQVVPKEQVDTYLRKRLYSTDATLPFGRDSGHYKLLQESIGITRRTLMEFIRAQKNIQLSKPSLNKPKTKQGIRLKKLELQSDLIFVRKDDLAASHPKYGKDEMLKNETYIITTVEAASNLVKLSYLSSKDQTNGALEKHILWFAKQFGVKPSSFAVRTDAGSEYSMSRIKKLCPDYKFVSSATTCERMNRSVQANFFRILKNRQARTIVSALKKAETMCNNTVSYKHGKTPKELVEDPTISKEIILQQHNKSRKEFKKGDNRGDFTTGDWVRVMAPEKIRRGIGYKTYKLKQYEKSVHKIIKTTTRAKVKKYRLDDKRWMAQDRLLLASPTDKKSQKLIKERDEEEEEELEQHRKNLQKEVAEKEAAKKGRKGAVKGLKKLEEQRKAGEEIDKAIEDDEKEFEKEKRVKPKSKDRNVTRKNSKVVAEFKSLVGWIEAEEGKVYAGKQNEKELDDIYNSRIKRGQTIGKQLRNEKVRLKGYSINYFSQFETQ